MASAPGCVLGKRNTDEQRVNKQNVAKCNPLQDEDKRTSRYLWGPVLRINTCTIQF